MHFTGLIPLLAVGTAYAAPAAAPQVAALEARQVPVLPCSHTTGGLHVLALGGANTNNPKDYGYLYSLSKSILNAIPGSTNVSVPYDKVLITNPPPNHLQPGAVANGMKTLKQYVVDYHHSCPQTKMAIIGYSSGGVIAMNDFCYGGDGNGTPQLNPLLAGNYIVAGVLYGEETRAVGESFNKGTCTTGHGTAPRANPSLCNTYAPYLQSYCDNNDPDCCVGGPQPYNVQVHFSYPAKYDAIATQFVKQRFLAAGGA